MFKCIMKAVKVWLIGICVCITIVVMGIFGWAALSVFVEHVIKHECINCQWRDHGDS